MHFMSGGCDHFIVSTELSGIVIDIITMTMIITMTVIIVIVCLFILVFVLILIVIFDFNVYIGWMCFA